MASDDRLPMINKGDDLNVELIVASIRALDEIDPMSVNGCDLNRSMQHRR